MYDKGREEVRPKGSRRRLAAFLGNELASVLDGRFRYVAIDAPPDRDAIEQVRAAVGRFRSPSDVLDRSKPLFAYGFLRPASSRITRSGNTLRKPSQHLSVEKRLSATVC